MKKIMILMAAAVFLFVGVGRSEAAEKKISIALMNIKMVNYSSLKAAIIPEMIYSKYSGNKNVSMISISQVKEQASRKGIDENNPDAEKLKELGRALKADKLVFITVSKNGNDFGISEKVFDVNSAVFNIEDKGFGVPESRIAESVRLIFDNVVGKIVMGTTNIRKEEQVKQVVKPVEKETAKAPVKKDAVKAEIPLPLPLPDAKKEEVVTTVAEEKDTAEDVEIVIKKAAEPGASVSKIAIGLLGYDIFRNDFSVNLNTFGLSVKLFTTGNAFALEGKIFGTYDNELKNIGVEANLLYHFLIPNGGPYLGAGIVGNYGLSDTSVKIAGALKGGCSIPLGSFELFGEGGADKGILFGADATGLSGLNIFGNVGFRVIF